MLMNSKEETRFKSDSNETEPTQMRKENIVVVGAGPAGLTAAYTLLKQTEKYHVVILEASDVCGGISKTVNHNGNRMDIGGHRFFSKDHDVMNLWFELMPEQGAPSYDDLKLNRPVPLSPHGPDPERTDDVMLNRTRLSRIYYKKNFFSYPVSLSLETLSNLGMHTALKAGFSYLKSLVKKLPETSLENFYINRFGKVLYEIFFEGYTEKLWGRHPRDISADWGSQRVKNLSIFALLKHIVGKILPKSIRFSQETSLIERFYYPKHGPGQLWEKMGRDIQTSGGEIIFNCECKSFDMRNGNIYQVHAVKNGTECVFPANYVISSMPLKDLANAISDIPRDILKIADGLPYRDFVTVGLLLDKLKIKNQTKWKSLNPYTPDCWIYVQDTNLKLGRIQIFNNWSPYMLKNPDSTLWVGLEFFCAENDRYWNLSEEEWKNFAIEELVRMQFIDSSTAIFDFHVEKVKKAYPAYFDTYSQISQLIGYLNTIPNLYCVGRNGQHRYNNMDHSMVTSFEAIKHILSGGAGDKSPIWNVNTEKEYHEEINRKKVD